MIKWTKKFVSNIKDLTLKNTLQSKQKKIHKFSSHSRFIPFVNFANNSNVSINHNMYNNNVIVYRCINLISKAISHVDFGIYKYGTITNRKIKDVDHIGNYILRNPNPDQSRFEFLNELISNKLLFGNAYVLKHHIQNIKQKPFFNLTNLNPLNIIPIIENDKVQRYQYSSYINNNHNNTFDKRCVQIDKSLVLHLKNYNPHDSYVGLPTCTSAKISIDIHNQSSVWNYSLLKNGARPTGAITFDNNVGGYLSAEQFDRLKEQIEQSYSGSSAAGKPLILEGGLSWKEMGIKPKDMDFLESKNSAAREIALSFGVPPQLLGINGDNTYSNMQEARIGLWEETILPMLDEICDAFSRWFSVIFEEDVIVSFAKDNISILSTKRHKLWNNLNHLDFMTVNEKREIAGLAPVSEKLDSKICNPTLQ